MHFIILMRLFAAELAVPQTFILLSVSLWNDLADLVFGDVGLAGLKSRANTIL